VNNNIACLFVVGIVHDEFVGKKALILSVDKA
jgi:hypothetical protein